MWRRRFWLRALLLTSLLPLFFGLILAVSMVGRDINAPSWITKRVEQNAAGALEGGSITFGAIVMNIGEDLHPRIRMTNVILRDATGVSLANIPRVDALVSPRGLILRREVLVQEVTISGAQVALRRRANGTVAVAFDTSGGFVQQADTFADLIDQFEQAFDRPNLEALEKITAVGMIVNYEDARAGRSWTVDDGQLSLSLRDRTMKLEAELAVLTGRSYVSALKLEYQSPRDARSATFSMQVTDAVAADLASQSAAFSWLAIVDAPISATLNAAIDDDGQLGPLSASLDIGAGAIRPNNETRPIPFQSAKTSLTYDPASFALNFSSLNVQSPWASFTGNGRASLDEVTNGLPNVIIGQFTFADLLLNPANLYSRVQHLDAAQIDFRMNLSPFTIDIGQAFVDFGVAEITAHGQVAASQDGWELQLDAEGPRITAKRVLSLWPVSVRPRTREWFVSNIVAGDLVNLAGALRIRPGSAPKWATNFEFNDAEVRFMKTMPPILGATGFASFQDNGFFLGLDQGHVIAPQGGRMNLAGSHFSIPNLMMPAPTSRIDLESEGTITAALALLDLPPFQYLTKADLPVQLADGRANVSAVIELPLITGLQPADVGFSVEAGIRSVRSDRIVRNKQVSGVALSLTADRTGMRITGPVQVGDVPMTVDWSREFGPGTGASQLTAEVVLNEAFLTEFRIGLPPGTVSGRAAGQLRLDLAKGQPPKFSLASDLSGLSLALPAIGWSKPAGSTGALTVEGTLGEVPSISRLSLDAAGLSAEGAMSLSDGGGLELAHFDRVQIGNWFDAEVNLRGRGIGARLAIEVRNGSLDLRNATFGPSGDRGGPMSIALDRMQVSDGITLTGFRGEFSGSGGFSGQFAAAVNDQAQVQGTVVPQNGRSAVRIQGTDAGAVFRALGFLRNANGGNLDLTLTPAGDAGTFDGVLAVTNLRVKDAPVLAGLLDAISVVGLLQQLDGQGMAFSAVDAQFRLTPNRVIVQQSSAVGPGLGLSMDGFYTIATKGFDFQGVVSPFFMINGIGSILTRPGEGLIGFNYNLTGTPDDLQVNVNPLSVFTPGMFREIFRRSTPEISDNPSQ